MATYRAPSKDEAEKIRARGFDPAMAVVDDRTGDVFGANDVPGPDYLTENLKSFVRAVPTVVTGPLRLGGAAADTVRQLTGEYQINDPSALTQTADWLDRKAAEFAPQDPRANGLATIPGQVVGQVAGVLGGSKLASILGSRGLSSLAGSAIGQSAAMTAGDTIQEEMERQAREEITQDPARALGKGLLTGGVTALLEGGLGVGKFLKSLDKPAGTTMGNMLKRAGMSAASEAGQEAGQMAVVEGEWLPEGIGTRALAGAIGGGVAGGAQGLALPTAQKPSAALSGRDMAAAKPAATTDQQQQLSLMDEPTREALLHMQRTGEEFDPVISTPQITMAKKLIEKGVPLDGDRLNEIASISDDTQLKQYANRLYTEHFRSAPVSEETTAKLVEKQQKEIGALDKQISEIRKQRALLVAKQEQAAEAGVGPSWIARNVEMIDRRIQQLDEKGLLLTQQLEMLVEANPLQQPMSERVVAARFPGQGMVQPTVSEAESGVAGPAVPMPNRVFEQPAPPQPAGLLTEGEQGLPFGSGPSVSPGSVTGARPVPETAEQIAAQIQLTIDPASTKKATLITPGSPFDAANSPLPVVETPHGLVAFNPSKTTREEVVAGMSGDVADGSLFGYGPGQTTGAAGAVAVDTTVGGTPGVLSQIVRTPEEARAAVAAQQAAAPEGETQVKPAGQVLDERQSSDPRYQFTLLPGESLWNDLKKSFSRQHSFNDETIATIGPAALYDFTQSSLGRMARDNPLRTYGAVVANKMFVHRNQIANAKLLELQKYKEFLKRDDVIAWMNEQTNDHKWDVSSLPAEIQPLAAEFIKFNESFTDEMRAAGQHVMDPRTGRSRLPEKLPGYYPYAFNKDVFDDLALGGDRADYWQDVWIKHYMRETGDSSPSGRAKAIEALRLQTSPMANITIVGGEPIFLSARRVHGMTIPPEMRDTNLVGAYETYIDRYAQDRVWTLDVQNDPLARRAFGASKDKQFNPVDDSAVEPTATQWDDILAAARKYNSPWISRVKPGMNLGSPVSNESPEALAFIQSFIQRPVQAQTDSARYAATGNAIASAMLMQTASGIRDASAGLSMGSEYVDIQRQIKNSVAVLADYAKARDAALRGGAMQDDVFRHQAAGVLGKASYRAIRALREITGRQILDQYPRVVLYSSAYEQVIDDLSKSGNSPLANEFSTPSTREKGSNDEIAAETAANIVERVAPSYDARNLPPGLVPQTANWLGHMIGLARWGVARYNNWFEDTLRPALRHGDMSRLIKTLFVGLLGAAATNMLIEELRRKKPAGLTWQEWLKLDTDAQIKHAAPLFMSLYQMNGTFGVAGDMMLPVLRAATGAEPLRVESVEPAMPLVIVGKQLFDKTTSFLTYAQQKNWKLDGEDLADFSTEMMSTMQLFRDLRDWSLTKEQRAEKEMVREERLYERLNARSARTDQPLEQPMFESPIRGQAFSLSKEFNSRDLAGLRSLVPTLIERAENGQPLPNVTQNKYEDKFWLDVARRRGVEKTRELYGVNAAEQEEDGVRKELLKELKRIRKRALRDQEDE